MQYRKLSNLLQSGIEDVKLASVAVDERHWLWVEGDEDGKLTSSTVHHLPVRGSSTGVSLDRPRLT